MSETAIHRESVEQVVEVWKVPKESEIDVGDFHEIGIFPAGELMAICPSREEAEALVDRMEEKSPSERFGETMDDAPYQFSVNPTEMWTQEENDV